ncbi:GGDEF domain-containing protein [Amycolatopsis sp. NBC_01480]|uniref:GGDEF domain-containing protein n=1 Tax=Amycolatopsis sp. NBC_01480 TaxID=2903562 RepID=UPI002E2C2358|nr:GGDEF domain-containing protein [Amycolatopsis sp. NBC_01480]
MPLLSDLRRRGWTNWAIWSSPRQAIVFLLVIDLMAVGAAAWSVVVPVSFGDLVKCLVLVGLGMAAAEMTRQVERRRRRFSDTPHVNFSSVWTLAGALLLTPALAALVAVVLYGHLWLRSWRGVSGIYAYKVVFSTCNVVLSCLVASWTARYLDLFPPRTDRGAVAAFGLMFVIALYFAVNSAVVATAIALIKQRVSAKTLLGPLNENILELATLCMGMLAALLLARLPWLVMIVFVPLYALHRSVLIRQFEQAATIDSKTGLLNAASWNAIAEAELDRAREHETDIGLLILDIDHFRQVNNLHGHLVGDQVLRRIGDALRSEVRSNDLCGRFGGEEFVILLPGTSSDTILDVANRIRQRVYDTRIQAGETAAAFQITVSIGAASFPAAGRTLQELMTAADNALFAAKDAGRNQVRVVEAR